MKEKKLLLLLTIFASIAFFSRCLDSKTGADPRGESYAGSATCVKCHASIYASYLHTAHSQSAAPASAAAIAGSFSRDSNSFVVGDTTKVVMEYREGRYWQVLYLNGREKRAEPFDIVFGKVKGQTYLYWKGDQAFQLPVSYFTALHSWTSSPGYAAGGVNFDRPVIRRCFECHSSYIARSREQMAGAPNETGMDKNSLIYNIDCERCHGPAAAHVLFHTENPGQREAKNLISYKSLSRAQKISTCAVCHSGNKNFILKSTFDFRPGDTLSHFMVTDDMTPARPDVHGNQTQLLASSKCFRSSDIDCSTCHNTHVNDRGNFAGYASHCMGCHTEAGHNFCKLADSVNVSFLKTNCTRCHMPAQASAAILVRASGSRLSTPCFVVNHRIAVYPAESKEILKKELSHETP
jgi:Cytochrome c554 and c-prime